MAKAVSVFSEHAIGERLVNHHGQRQQRYVKVREHVAPTKIVVPKTAPPAENKT